MYNVHCLPMEGHLTLKKQILSLVCIQQPQLLAPHGPTLTEWPNWVNIVGLKSGRVQ